MAKCQDCKKEMLEIQSCDKKFSEIEIEGKVYQRDTNYFDVNKHCHDCGIVNEKGNIHHFGCDMERCPACSGQLISCNCKEKNLI